MLGKLKNKLGYLFAGSEAKRHSLVGSPRLWQMKRQFQIAFLQEMGLQPHHRLLDIGCGTLRGGLPIIEYLQPGRYWGIEPRQPVLEEGRKELRAARLETKKPNLIHFDNYRSLHIDETFDFIWAFSVLIHMSDAVLSECLAFVRLHVRPKGLILANVHIGDQADGEWQGFPVVWRSVDFYRQMALKHNLNVVEVGNLSSLGHKTGITTQDSQVMLQLRLSAD